MDYQLEDLVDIELLQRLQEKLNVIYSFPSAIIDNNGKILTSVAWQDICTKFHRLHPQCEEMCIKSDKYISDHLHEANPAVSYICPHGLTDNATPIIIDGKHLGNFFTGQFFLGKPNLDFFREQAKKYGFEEQAYMKAVRKTPVWSKEKLSQYLDFIKDFIEIIAGLGLKNIRQIESNLALKNSEARNRAIIQSTSDWIWELDKQGNYCYCSENIEQILGFTPDEVIGKSPFDQMTREETGRSHSIYQGILVSKGEIIDLENWNLHRDGHEVCLLTNGFPLMDEAGNLRGYMGTNKDITEKKYAEELLTKERGRLSSILKGTNSGSWEWNIQTGETVFNERWAEIIGYTLAELSPLSVEKWKHIAHPQDVIVSGQLLKKHFRGESDFYEFEMRLRHKSGDWIWVLDRGKVHAWDKDGNPLLMSGSHVDITRRKKAEIALRESEALLAEAEKVAKFGSWRTDLSNFRLSWSSETCRIFGLEPGTDQPDHTDFLSFVHPEDRLRVDEAFAKSFDGHELNSIEHRIITPNGDIKFIEERWQIFHDDHGVAKRAVGTCQVITERKEAELEIRRLNERISIATQSAQVGIWEWSLPNNSLIWDDQMYALYGQKKEAFTGDYEAWLNGIHPDDKDATVKEVQKAISNEKEYDTEFRVVWADGSTHFLKAKGHIIRNGDGKPLRMIGVNYDITERKQAESELLKAKDRAEEGDRLKTAFLANMSHEIRTPMNGILGFANLLKEQKLSGEEQQQYIAIIEKSGERMLNIINDIVDISKIESGQMKLFISATNINEQINFTYTFFKQEAENKGIKLMVKKPHPARDLFIFTDREKVYAILTNLVKNAIKFTPAGTIEFGYDLNSSELTFYVKDTGIGIPNNRQRAIFDRFIQADIGDKWAYQGAGLGLSISRAYVQMLGGNIWVESEPGRGSTFYFTLPYHTEPLKDSSSAALHGDSGAIPGINPEGLRLRILIVEDDESSAMLVAIGVKKYVKEIIKVKNGVEAVLACRNNPGIDLILMDIKMPQMDGYEATRQIRHFNNDVIIIAQTAYALIGDREKALESGCNDYIAKPFDKNSLITLIKKYF